MADKGAENAESGAGDNSAAGAGVGGVDDDGDASDQGGRLMRHLSSTAEAELEEGGDEVMPMVSKTKVSTGIYFVCLFCCIESHHHF
jgi:hypothetical protein